MAKLSILTPFNIELEFETASIIKRALAYFLDIFIASIYAIVLHMTLFKDQLSFQNFYQASYLFAIVLPLYFYPFISEILMDGQSAGKKIMGIRVVDQSGNAASVSQYFLRWIISIPNLFFVLAAFYLWIQPVLIIFIVLLTAIPDAISYGITQKGKRLGDLAAGTVVVNNKYVMDIQQTIFRHVTEDLTYNPKYPEVMKLSDRDINSIRNLLNQKRTKDLNVYAEKITNRIEEVLKINNISGDTFTFFEELLTDYNYLTKNK
ncbi:MAG TPA: RDD family protein [Edaphocola sp.]|nr:RDD family protein [Edaphocola sp.]